MTRNPAVIYEDMTATAFVPYSAGAGIGELKINFEKEINFDAVYISSERLKKITISRSGNILFEKDNIAQKSLLENIGSAAAEDVTVTVEPYGNNIKIYELKFLNTVVNLGCCAVDFTRADYAKQGHFYLNDGSLLAWKEYQKAAGNMSISNCSFEIKEKILKAFEDNFSLLFNLNPGAEAVKLYDFALVKTPTEKFDIKTGMFEFELNLAQR